jgi:hypothetical protein
MVGAIPRKYLGFIGLVMALHDPDLLGAPLFRGHAEFGSNGIRVNQLLGEARFGEYERRYKNQMEK